MASSGMLRHVALVRTDVSEELSAFLIIVTRIGELGTTLAVISNRRTLCSVVQNILMIGTGLTAACVSAFKLNVSFNL
jgi:hypothetical protein